MQAGFRAHAIGAVLSGVLSASGVVDAAEAAAASWAVERTPNPSGAQDSALSAISCPSAAGCMAVGHFTTAGGTGAALAERWNGRAWAIALPRRPTGAATSLLFDVSCSSTTNCMAVGSVTDRAGATVPLAERWTRSGWAVLPTVRPRAFPGAISYLGGVSCASARTCTAVGYSGDSAGTRGAVLVERWNGARWSIERTPHRAGTTASFLSGVSCTSSRSCIAVGFANRPNGTAVSLAERRNGSGWAVARTPNPSAGTTVRLAGVSCVSPRSCTAVGSFTIITGIEIMLAERWDGTHWTIERTLYPSGARLVQFSGVSCTSTTFCTAVGSFNNVAGIDVTLAERREGADWTIELPPDPSGSTGASLAAVSCRSPSACIAVGTFTGPDGTGMTLAEGT